MFATRDSFLRDPRPNNSLLKRDGVARLATYLGCALISLPILASCAEETAHDIAAQRLNDQKQSLKIFRKISGRMDGEPYFVSVRGNVYAWKANEPAEPVASIVGLWTYQQDAIPGDDSAYVEKRVYCGTYIPFAAQTPAPTARNPLNGKTIKFPKVRTLVGTGFYNLMKPDGAYGLGPLSGKKLFPKRETTGSIHESQITGDYVTMIQRLYNQDFLKHITMKYEEVIWSADLAALIDDSDKFVPSNWTFVLAGDARELKWLELDEDQESYHVKHVTGRKVASVNELPKNVLDFAKANCPKHLDGSILPEPKVP